MCKVVPIHAFILCCEACPDLTELKSCGPNDEVLRLVGSSGAVDNAEGVVEICVGVYLPVYGGTFWNMSAAEVVCRQLGLEGMLLYNCCQLFPG